VSLDQGGGVFSNPDAHFNRHQVRRGNAMHSFPFSGTLALMGVVFCFYVWSGFWIYKDAKSRGKPALLFTVLVMLFAWPIGLVIWIAVRPEGQRRFNPDDYRAQ